MRNLLLIFCLVWCGLNVGAQNKLTDSLKRVLLLPQSDTSRVLTICELGLQYRNTNPDSSIYYSEKAMSLAREIHFLRGQAMAISNLGIAFREKGDLPRSLELELQGLKIAESNHYILEMAFCLRRIGLIYMDLKNYPVCLQYLRRSLSYSLELQNKRGIAIENMNVGMTFEYMNQIDSAFYYIQLAEKGKEFIEDLYPEVNRVFGNIYSGKGDKEKAIFYFNKGISEGLKLNDFRTISFICSDAARMFRKNNQPDSGIAYAKKGVEFGLKASYKKGILFSGTMLSEWYDSIDPKQALYYYKVAAAAKDSLFGAGNIQTIQALISKEESRQKEIEIAKTRYQNKLRQYGLLAGLFLFLVIAFLLYRNNIQKQKANSLLLRQNDEIQKQKEFVENTLLELKSTQSRLIQAEKMASLGELTAGIAHEIQNPLNFVNNFSQLNTELSDELEEEAAKGHEAEVKEIVQNIKANSAKITHHGKRADAIVKGMLQHSQAGKGQKESSDLNALSAEYLKLAYHGLRGKDSSFSVTMKTEFDPCIGMINIIPQDIGRVLMNVYNNAFYTVLEKKKADRKDFEPMVSVTTKKQGDKILITIKDNGAGISQTIADKIFQPFFTTKPTGQGTGLGLSLSYDIMKAAGGEIVVQSVVNEGSQFTISLPC